MTPDQVKQIVGDTPHMRLAQAHQITDLIKQHGIKDVIELGFAHGVSTCYFAAAVEEAGGSVVAIDREGARKRRPEIEGLLTQCGYLDRVERYYEPRSYLWRLMKFLEQDATPRFDLCYIDGAHDWYVDGFAFFLIDRLLRKDGWIVFDDLNWTYARSPSLHDADWVKALPQEERETPQIRKVYELLVKTHPNYGDFQDRDGWAYAHKLNDSDMASTAIRQEVVYVDRPAPRTFKRVIARLKRSLARHSMLSL